MMRRAGRVQGLRAIALATAAVLGAVGLNVWNRVAEANQAQAASSLVLQLLTADTAQVPGFIRAIGNYRRWTDPELRRVLEESSADPKAKLHARLALLPVDPTQVANLEAPLLNASPGELLVLRNSLEPHRSSLIPKLWNELESARAGQVSLLPAAGALALYDTGNPRWSNLGAKVAQEMVRLNPFILGSWLDALRPVRGRLTASLVEVTREKDRPESEQILAFNILADYVSDDPSLLAELLVADPHAYRAIFPVFQRQVDKALPVLWAELDGKATITSNGPPHDEQDKDRLAQRQARAAVALVRLGHADTVWPLLQHSADPRLRSFIVNWLKPLDVDTKVLTAEFDQWSPRSSAKKLDNFLFDRETSIQRALILALGTYRSEDLPPSEREPLTAKLLELYRNDPDAGIHGAAELTLRQWKQQEKLKDIDTELRQIKDRDARRWYVNGQGQTFAVIDGPVEFLMGSPQTDTERNVEREIPHKVAIPRRFAIATKEVTVEQFQRFLRSIPNSRYELPSASDMSLNSPHSDGPWIAPSWYLSAHYCNWLSKQEGLTEDQWCYQSNKDGLYAEGMAISPDALERKGYRLPTEAEWEYACRAGTVTSRYHGDSVALLGRYAWSRVNSQEHAWPGGSLLPNDLGLFDMLGNVYEWCQDRGDAIGSARTEIAIDASKKEIISDKRDRILRGGAFYVGTNEARSADREVDSPSQVNFLYGFRLARTCN